MSYVRPAMLHRRSTVREMYGVQLKDRKSSRDLILMFSLNETIDQLAMTNSIHWHGHVLRRENSRVFKMVLKFVVEGQRKKARLKKT